MTVEAWDRAQENKLATGKILALNNMIDTATGTVRLRAIFENEDLTLFPNQFVNVKLILQTLHDQNLIPTFAIQHNPDGAFVYVVTPTNTVTMRAITTGIENGNITSVTKGLETGEVIAVDNFNKLGPEGVKVNPRKPGEEAQGGGGKHTGGSYGKKATDPKESP
jgi:multidrug efflux system membrane fusion protein